MSGSGSEYDYDDVGRAAESAYSQGWNDALAWAGVAPTDRCKGCGAAPGMKHWPRCSVVAADLARGVG